MKVTLNGFLYWYKPSWKDEPEFIMRESANYAGSCGPDYSLVGPLVVEADVPDDFDPIPGQIDALKQKKTAILADAQLQANNIDEQIQRLLCIEYKPEAA